VFALKFNKHFEIFSSGLAGIRTNFDDFFNAFSGLSFYTVQQLPCASCMLNCASDFSHLGDFDMLSCIHVQRRRRKRAFESFNLTGFT